MRVGKISTARMWQVSQIPCRKCRKSHVVSVASPMSQDQCRKFIVFKILTTSSPYPHSFWLPPCACRNIGHGFGPLNDGADKPAFVPQIRADKTRDVLARLVRVRARERMLASPQSRDGKNDEDAQRSRKVYSVRRVPS